MANRTGDTMKTSPAVKCMKLLMTIFNVFFLLTGVVVLALGIWIKVESDEYSAINDSDNSTSAWVLIGIGIGIMVFGLIGCCSTIKGISYLLYAYAFVLVLLFITELAVAIAIFASRDKISDTFEDSLQDAMEKYSSSKDKRDAVDSLQQDLNCCGSDDYTDWFQIDWEGDDTANATENQVPKSCCKDEKNCEHTDLPDQEGEGTSDIYTKGCHKKWSSFVEENLSIIGGVELAFCFIVLMGAILACCLGRHINKAQYDQLA